ncbi:PepSY domain-containing protein [Streptomyces sp. NBC_00237]|uniref:PepSY domain-containing protein n=1 Tax=Streptomyces sp. NBC_00237 TaxID=2975687 RepID=UPI00224C933B|nr:PepSY domain-containing protein [Streptomyces sp. NBC_00237]MCX5204151.1 PepSY domain-containing protein [Streptomyces sp. NBC_00237]
MKMKRKSVIAAAAVVVLVGGGTATALSLPSEDGPKAAPGVSADVNRAVSTAASAVPGTVTGVDLEDDGREWDVDVFGEDGKWHDVTLDPSGAKVRDDHVDAGDDDRDDHAPKGADVTVQQAVASALKTVPGHVTEADLERGHWEIEVRGKDGRHQDVTVDATTGKAVVAPKDQDDAGADAGADNAADDRAATTSDD